MSYLGQMAHENAQPKKRDRPSALDIPDKKAASDREVRSESEGRRNQPVQQPRFHVSPAEEPMIEQDYTLSRSASATSSLDPYYFGLQSPSDSPIPPLPAPLQLSATPDIRPINEPLTPAKDPAAIDRRALVGVGELSTPRWVQAEQDDAEETQEMEVEVDEYDVVLPEDADEDGPDSPWTIEAIDGESDGKDDPTEVRLMQRSVRGRPSITDESGGEEILYPRKCHRDDPFKPPKLPERSDEQSVKRLLPPDIPPKSAPSAFNRKTKKRTSDEFEMDQSGVLVSKNVSKAEEKASARKHRSLGVGISSSTSREKGKERRRDSAGLTINSTPKIGIAAAAKGGGRHSRQTSASPSSSSHGDGLYSRRVHTADFSHLPPSPSSSSIQHLLRHTGSANSAHTPPLRSSSRDPQSHPSPNVAHSLLRGTQEGWSGLDDEATAEALRKLDGLSGKTTRARASVGSFGRPGSISRPGTPSGKSGTQWEGIIPEGAKTTRRNNTTAGESAGRDVQDNDTDRDLCQVVGIGLASGELLQDGTRFVAIGSSDDQQAGAPPLEKASKKSGFASVHLSLTPKRGSTSSTACTNTAPGARDSTSLSAATSLTSMPAPSGRHSTGKARRNSAGSDISSAHSSDGNSLKDRVASLATSGDAPEDNVVPPVPPLPKDLSTYKPPPLSTATPAFPTVDSIEDQNGSHGSDPERTVPLEVLPFLPPNASSLLTHNYREGQHYDIGFVGVGSPTEASPILLKTPSKKWSFSNRLNIKLSNSPSSSGPKSTGFPLSPRSVSFGQQLRKSRSKDQALSPTSLVSKSSWSPVQPDAMTSAASLASMSSAGSVHATKSPGLPSSAAASNSLDRGVRSGSGTDSSASTHYTTPAVALQHAPLSPTSSMRRGQVTKRLTPSSIPFFRRSSSQSMHFPPPTVAVASSPTHSSGPFSSIQPTFKASKSSPKDCNPPSSSVAGMVQKKSSVLSLGLPSLLKGSSSRRSFHAEKNDDSQRAKDAEKEKLERERQKKEDKDRSESRISVLMGRKRGKTLSSTDPRKSKPQVELPPMQMSALPAATTQRIANLKLSGPASTPAVSGATRSTSSRLTSQTVSSMQKQSDTSLRTRNQLPTIAGSPSVGTNSSQTSKEGSQLPPSLTNSSSGIIKETPTKIPRISSRTSTVFSPPLKNPSALASRRTSMNVSGLVAPSTTTSPIPPGLTTDEFGVMENGDAQSGRLASGLTSQRHSTRASPSTTSRVPRQVPVTASSSSGSFLQRKGNRDSVSLTGLRKSSTGSVASISSVAPSESQHRFSALSPSKGLKLLSPKMSLSTAKVSNSSTNQIHQTMASPSSSRQSLSTPSPVPSSIDEEELAGDEEMMHYIRRQQAKKMAVGAAQEELDDLLRFPEPLPPVAPSSPSAILKSNQVQYLSEYERKEILDYSSIYSIGARGKKKPATIDNTANNYGYDDERGDYFVVNHDHLAYRYEIIDTLGKGSFGQVLHCRDHSTGESMAIKIIRNKKRFHHQALVEIKILDNLRKWDSDEKHHVIKMSEHFYFRNHLCIAMELLSINLYELIKANGFVGFTTALIRRFTSQMLLSLSLMRYHRIVHCDLKPENVLLRHPAKSAIKVIDFGSSCFEHEKIYTYIQSRFYRSPEVILGMNYHMAIDMWSLGCILAELYTGFPIFPGENEQEQLSCIMEVLGVPEKEFVNRSSRKKLFFDPNGVPRAVINSKGRRRRPGTKTLTQVLRCNDEDFVDFIGKCLVWDPERRIKPQAAMRHPFITAGRRTRVVNSSSVTAKTLLSSSSLGNRVKGLTETPKKSQISAPTPLTARSSRITSAAVPSTPNNSSMHSATFGSSSRSYRTSQSQGLSYHSSRTLNGFAATATK